MSDSSFISRRDALKSLAVGALGLAGLESAVARPAAAAPVSNRVETLLAPQPGSEAAILPLPFDP